MTASASFALAIAAVVLGLVAGFVIARFSAGAGRRPVGPSAADLLDRFMRSSNNGVLVLNRFGDLVLHNRRAEDLGLVKENHADARARMAAEQVLETGEPTEVDLSPLSVRRRAPEAVLGQLRPLEDGYTVVEAIDHSEAVRLEATRRDFVANVSHELKTPVGAIALLAEAVLDAADDSEEVRRFGEKILRESTRLGTLVTELIALSRLQGAERLPELTVVDVDAVVTEALGRTKLAAESADIAITTDGPSGLTVEGDPTLLVTALSNLLDNAVSYSHAGSPVSVSRRLAGDCVEIAVTDRGIGIPPDAQQRVFERFYRADKARSRATGGTGLGLAIVKHAAANHGGEVRLWSKPGVGSTFTVRLPARQDEDSADGHARQEQEFGENTGQERVSEEHTSQKDADQVHENEGRAPQERASEEHAVQERTGQEHTFEGRTSDERALPEHAVPAQAEAGESTDLPSTRESTGRKGLS